ncbi:MAG: DUF6701 domain-containing protein, partial [Rhodoferax sp.]
YTTGSSNGSGAAVGVQLTSADYTQYAYDQTFIDTTVGTSILWYPANQLATKTAEYRFDESAWLGTAGEIKDTSGNSQDASRIGLATSVDPGFFPGGKLCRGGSFPNNTSNTLINAVATPMVPSNQGSIDFWFNSNVKWNSAAAMLLDATTAANRPFFLMKSATGALTFVVSDTAGTTVTATAPAQTYALNTWHHIGIAWNVRAGSNQTTLSIFLDGLLQNNAPTRGTTNGFLSGLSSVYVGDNRTSGITPTGGTPNSANGSIDEVYFYGVEISAPQALADKNLTRATCSALDHFHIIHDGTVSSCTSPALITIEAHDASHALFTLAGTSINLSTTPAHGTWSNVSGGSINNLTAVVAGAGTASYTFANENSVTFGLSDNLTESLNINVASGAITEHTGTASACVVNDYTTGTTCDAPRSFLCAPPFGFNCIESGADPLTGHLYTKLAGTAFQFDVVALKDTNGNGTADAVDTAYASGLDKSLTVELVDGTGATTCSARTAISPAVSQSLIFTKANQPTEQGRKSTAPMTVSNAYTNLRCRVTDANQAPSVVSCSTDNFSVRPSAATLVTSAIAIAPTSTNTPIIKAGANFSLQATTSVGNNYAGSLALDTSKLTAQTTTQASTPAAGGNVGALTPTALVGNAAAVNATYSEVGYVYLDPGAFRDDSFTAVDSGNGDCVTSTGSDANLSDVVNGSGQYGCSIGNKTKVSLGRFIPDHFDTVVAQGCVAGSFTYSAQPFIVTVTARNAASAVTQNYAGSFFAKATTISNAGVLANLTVNPINPLAANTFVSGIGLPNVTYTFPSPTTNPLAITLRAVDSDLVSSLGFEGVASIANIRSGRVQFPNAYGSEFLALKIPVTVQYWSNGWQPNAVDSCTTIAATQFAWTFPAGAAPRPNNLMACKSIATLSGSSPNYWLNLSAPGTGNAGWADLTLNLAAAAAGNACISASPTAATTANTPWLQFNWTGTTGNPKARATFGTFGNRTNPTIYRRENY